MALLDSPQLGELLDQHAAVTFCQSGSAALGWALDTIDPRIEASGPIALLAGLSEDRLLIF